MSINKEAARALSRPHRTSAAAPSASSENANPAAVPEATQSVGAEQAPPPLSLLDRVERGKNMSRLHRAVHGIGLLVCLLLVVYSAFSRDWVWALAGGVALVAAAILWHMFDDPKGGHANVTKWTVVVAFAATLSLLIWKLAHALGPHPSTQFSPQMNDPPDIPRRAPSRHQIVTPAEGAKVKPVIGTSEAGRIPVTGVSPPLPLGRVLLLTVAAENDHIDRPQIATTPITPDSSGHWNAMVQVGNASFPPQPDQRFTLKLYVVTDREYQELRQSAGTGGALWPPVGSSLPAPVAQREFVIGR